MTIRPAQAGDYSEIYSLVQTAFVTAKVSDGTEQDFVLELRRRDPYRPELELVAEENGQLIGHILLTNCRNRDNSAKKYDAPSAKESDVRKPVKRVAGLNTIRLANTGAPTRASR